MGVLSSAVPQAPRWPLNSYSLSTKDLDSGPSFRRTGLTTGRTFQPEGWPSVPAAQGQLCDNAQLTLKHVTATWTALPSRAFGCPLALCPHGVLLESVTTDKRTAHPRSVRCSGWFIRGPNTQ